MLDETVVNVLRMRNMSDVAQALSEKWRRTFSIVDWLTAHIPEASKFQIYAFNTHPWALMKGSDGKWLEGNDVECAQRRLKALHELVPQRWHEPRECIRSDREPESAAGPRDSPD